MEAAETPLEVLSRAAVMLQRNVLPPPSYDEARSLSQQSQKSKLPRKLKTVTNEVPIINSTSSLPYDQIGNDSSSDNSTGNNSGKWKREKKHQQKTTVVASMCDSTYLKDYKSNDKYFRSNSSSSSNSIENGAEPLDMSKRPSSKGRGEPPSYFQSIMSSNYTRQQSNILPALVRSSDDSPDDDKETMCDQVINEHFRRSLGEAYGNVFSTNKKNDNQAPNGQPSSNVEEKRIVKELTSNGRVSPSPLSVDDHFAKALGDTWIKLQQKQEKQQSNQNSNNVDNRKSNEN